MKKILIRFAVLFSALAPILVRAGGDEVVLIYNSRVPESKSVAEHYAKMRLVPEKQIYGFDLTTNEEMSRAEFHDSLQLPLAKRLEDDGLWEFATTTYPATNGQPEHAVNHVVVSKIRYAVLCYGVPLKIAPDSGVHEAIAEKRPPEFRRNEASVDSELAWLPLVKIDFPLSGPFPNWIYCVTNAAALNPTNGILLVARLDGPTAEIARGLVDKAIEAETDGLWGRAYFDARGLDKTNVYFPGDAWILSASEISRQLGFETVVDDKPATFPASFPMSQIAIYCGWYDDKVDGPFTMPKVEFMPGAIAYHLHSNSATTIRSTTECWVGPLLAKGATVTMGCVYEPYLQFTPNVAAFFGLLGGGYTFGEAAWAAQPALSWQTTVVGDPLYRPLGKSPQVLNAKLSLEHNPLDEWSYLRLANLGLVHGTPMKEVSGLLENLDVATNSAVLTEKLADLYNAQGKPSSAIETYQHALKLNPSPQQKIRIRLVLAGKLTDLKRQKDTCDDLQKLLDENPDYPDRFSILKRLLDVAIALGDKDEITRCTQDMQKYAAQKGN
ncbi:MAG TPA: TIGR03790 family protein [Verrucomicrobiae bacterium]|nr:TIGR03790 family protein [Verrucomicrobiae bacterium]